MKLLNLTLDNFKGTKHFFAGFAGWLQWAVYGETTGRENHPGGRLVLAVIWGGFQRAELITEMEASRFGHKGPTLQDYAVAATIDLDGQVHTLRRVSPGAMDSQARGNSIGENREFDQLFTWTIPL